jgi:trimeric autotransporter adhesin
LNLPRQLNGTVYAVAETADAVYYGGSFTRVGSVAASNVVRVDKATGVATPLGTPDQNGTNGVVRALAVIGTDLFVGGGFYTVSDSSQANQFASNIAKWSTTEEKWSLLGIPTPPSSSSQNGTNGAVFALAVTGTDLFVGGYFTR